MAFVWYLSITAQAAVVCRLLYLGLPPQYPRFLHFALFTFCKSTLQLAIGANSPSYPAVWVVTESLSVVFLALAALEVYEKTVGRFPSAGDFGSRKRGPIALVGMLAALSAFFILEPPVFWTKSVSVVLAVKAFSLASAFSFVALTSLYYARLVVPERRNIRRHRRIFAASCFIQAIALSLTLMTGKTTWNLALAAGNAACWAAWAISFSRKGQVESTAIAQRSDVSKIQEQGRDLASALASGLN